MQQQQTADWRQLPPSQKEQLLAHLQKENRELAPARDPLARPYKFRGANAEIQTYRGHEFILSGPAETGKTVAALYLLDSLLRRTPRAQAVLARKVHADVIGSVLNTYRRIQELRTKMGETPASPFGGEKPEWFDYPNGARLWIVGLDRPSKALSTERDWIYVNQAEELKVGDWETLLTRCTGRGAVTKTPMLFGDCNPSAEDHWILKREGLRIFHSKHVDNPMLYDERGNLTEQGERTMRTLMSLTGVRKSRLYLGLWVGAEGLYFDEWDDALHSCRPFDVPGDWPIWGAFDHGFNHNSAFILFTENDGIIYVIGEHVKNRLLPPIHCIAIRRLLERRGVDFPRLRQIVAGHDCFQVRGDSLGKTIADQYAEAIHPETGERIGLVYFEHANIARIPGASEMLGRLGNAKSGIRPTLRIFDDCRRTIMAITTMVADKDDPEDVKKVDADINGDGGDDAYDALRYGLMARPMPRAVFGILSQTPTAPDYRPVNELDAILRKNR